MADLIFIIILLIFITIGRMNGFLKGLASLVCVIISCVGGYLMYPYFTSFLVETPLFGTISKAVSEYISKAYQNGGAIENLNELMLKYNVTAIEDLFAKISEGITLVIINIISIAVIFIALRLILSTLKGITKLISKLPVISSLDKLLGVVTGIVSGLLITYLIVAVMMIPPCNKSEISRKMCEEIDKSVIAKHVMDYNIFINYDSLSQMGEET